MAVRARATRPRATLYRDEQASAIRLVTAMSEVGLGRPTMEQASALITYLCDTEWAAQILHQGLDAASDLEH